MADEQYVRTGRTMFILAWLVFFIVLFIFFYYYGQEKKSDYEMLHGRLIIGANQQGHYLISGAINGQAVNFMLDTGATLVAVPQSLANRIHLQGRYPVSIQTASGQVAGLLTRLEQLSFGKFTINNIKAVIIPNDHDETVLMGMNVLGQFNLNQKDGQLIITR